MSIIIPCHNCGSSIDKTLASIRAQSFQDFEIYAVDDGSSDDTHSHLQRWQDKFDHFQIFRLENNIGPGGARNYGVDKARAHLIALIDSDDVWRPEKLAQQVFIHQQPECVFSCTGFLFRQRAIIPATVDYHSLLKHNQINTSSVMFDRRSVSIKFASSCKSEDYIAWLEIARSHRIHALQEVLVERCDEERLSQNKLGMAMQRWQIYREVEHLGWLESLYYFAHYAISGTLKHWRIPLHL
ncbi:MAG: glycosyltransferase family 2 protein [Gammaproteobacteria bacterium]|nr:glycosyltransferase family 2 protein [Gammaproteobacteria bacterium]